ncbi:tyrosine-type recombinase/integrase [Deinococcus metallilatus]|uniref:Recombinase XerC n=1 Tax=Deinococcus metallilatus TaxID=1211322 RepID=A0AAJ5F0C6_9DEIO|nr:tyrosine-type recombinase/integrase [Deinococcus metallilatus]MBB5297420.1 site-specific recombinase XerD [Deinococcus metallilatus]RXJ08060.1 recombinase XerC [Deinococcus metallilatus]TLK20826.1 recombinase XerC [Deinococcus metallilatus]GMA17018.1 integrase [Deinococcus metallilatus]
MTHLTSAIPAFESYLTQEEGLSPATARQYRHDCLKLAGWLGQERPALEQWEAVTARDLRAYMQHHKPAPARARRLVSAWKKLWRYLSEVEGLKMQAGPAELKTPKLPARLPKALTSGEVSRLLIAAREQSNDAKGLRDWAVLAFLYGTGCRISEALSLTFPAIEYDADRLPMSVRLIGKGNKERQVFLSPTAQRALHQWLRVRRTQGHATSAYVFSHLTGKNAGEPFPVRTIEAAMQRIGKRAGLRPEQSTPHKLRHTHATALVDVGRRIEDVKEVLGHASIATTQMYTRVNKNRLAATAASLPDVLDSP